MTRSKNANNPPQYQGILTETSQLGFDMASVVHIGSLLRTLVASKPAASFLELGTGSGLALSWLLDGMDWHAEITSIDNDTEVIGIADEYLGSNSRANIICTNGGLWIQENKHRKFDLIFADTWPGKYEHLQESLHMVQDGGFYVIDDMHPHSLWTETHAEKALKLVGYLDARDDFQLTKMEWASGIIVTAKLNSPNIG
ncbi:MAG: SAM-dependent methyltransferase [Saprospiraceae bacterium]|nr:SAM-dependent methyltransferase [Saprospiraceae bacterium]